MLNHTSDCESADAFKHRGFLGWIRDLNSLPRPHDAWPSIIIDDALMEDYRKILPTLARIGIHEITLWGLFTARSWSVHVEQTVDAKREQQIRDLIALAHEHKLKVLAGLGVYSWGFEEIIAAHTDLSDNQGKLMRLSNPASWQWQKRVIDYLFTFPIDGVSLQSADQGRSDDPDYASWSDVQYHAALNHKVAEYIKSQWPDALVGISGWGMSFANPDDLEHLQTMTQCVDYLIDVEDSARRHDALHRRAIIDAIAPTTFGSTGAPNVEPPQHWDRERWFLPTLQRPTNNIKSLWADGGRAVENYMHTFSNPADEVSIRLRAAVECAPEAPWEPMLEGILTEVYKPANDSALTKLVDLFRGAEDAYFENAINYGQESIVRLEPLIGDRAGPPIYLSQHMTVTGRNKYKAELQRLHTLALHLEDKVASQGRMQTVTRCIERVLNDIKTIG